MPSEKMAGLMASAIVSDTVMFKSPTCTSRDVEVARRLARIANVSLEELGQQIFAASSGEDKSAADTAGLYDTVEIFMENLGKSRKIQLVTTLRQDALKGWISKESPVGRAVMGRKAGDRVYVDMGSGKGYYLQIRAIEKGTDNGDIPIGSF